MNGGTVGAKATTFYKINWCILNKSIHCRETGYVTVAVQGKSRSFCTDLFKDWVRGMEFSRSSNAVQVHGQRFTYHPIHIITMHIVIRCNQSGIKNKVNRVQESKGTVVLSSFNACERPPNKSSHVVLIIGVVVGCLLDRHEFHPPVRNIRSC